jgi:hypothetical protein
MGRLTISMLLKSDHVYITVLIKNYICHIPGIIREEFFIEKLRLIPYNIQEKTGLQTGF